MPRTGIEPALPCDNQILSLARLPVPPSGHYYLITVKLSGGMQYYVNGGNLPKYGQGIFSCSNSPLFAALLHGECH